MPYKDLRRRRKFNRLWARKNRKKNPKLLPTEETRNRHRNVNYKILYNGFTLEQFNAMAVAQNGLCFLCGRPPNGKGRRLHIDHDHLTKKVRKLLCHNCNTAIGKLQDDPALLRAAADYIERHRICDLSAQLRDLKTTR